MIEANRRSRRKIVHSLFQADVAWVIALRLWNIAAGAILIVSASLFLSKAEQGYYYTFLSIVALQVLFDLGLSQTIAQIASHEFATVSDENYAGSSNTSATSRISFLIKEFKNWYRIVSALFVVIISLVGYLYFTSFGRQSIGVAWMGPWFALIATTGLNLRLSPRLALIEGAGEVGKIARLRIVQSIAGYVLLVSLLAIGAGLWAVAAVPMAALCIATAWLRLTHNPYRRFSSHVIDENTDHSAWRKDILHLQWRVAAAWLGGYFASQAIVPTIFALQGAIEAGRIGMSMQIFAAVQNVGMSWMSARAPQLAKEIALGQRARLNRLFRKSAARAIASTLAFAAILLAGYAVANGVAPMLTARVVGPYGFVALAIICVVNTAIYSMGTYMRAHKEEPMVLSSLIIGLLTFLAALTGGNVGTNATLMLYLAVTVLVSLPWTTLLFRTYYRRA